MKSLNDEIDHFKSTPWCSTHLQSPDLDLKTLGSRTAKARSEVAFFGELLNNTETITALIIAYLQPKHANAMDEVKSFVTLGSKVNGWLGICHGGLIATILDEVPTMLMKLNIPGRSFMTASLSVKFLIPVRTPGTVMVVSKLEGWDGRKVYVQSIIESEDGTKLVMADALYVESRARI